MTTHKTEQRNARLESEIRSVLADLLRLEVKDPRLEGVTVSGVRLSAERSHARVYFSLYGDAERERHARDGFAAAGAFLRRELGRRVRMRTTPELEFLRDSSYEYGDRMERIFNRLQSEGRLPADGSSEEEPEP
jgi:ribosome-binding factor A